MNDAVGRILMKWRINVVLPHIRGRLLDVGCGTNELVKAYKGEGLGADVYQWGTVDVLVKDTAHLPFKDQEFDTVTIIAALNHIPNREQVLIETRRLLKPDGRIVVTMIPPFISRLWHRVRAPWDADQRDRGMKEGEVFGLSAKQIENLLNKTGFQVERHERFMGGINLLTVARPCGSHAKP
jgi:SAM-dependent methyltransferase